MQTSGLPTRISVPFANSGTKNTIPVDSQIGITAGAASFTDGFPPLTMTSVSAGGVPPYGADFNGILNAITVAIRWNTAGGGYPFDSDFASSVAGYPEGALLPASDYSGYWLNTIDANSTSPENSTSETTGWVPGINYGVTAITGLSGSSVTLTTLQAAKSRITLSGTLTSNINVFFPAWNFNWTVVNNCTGNFSVTCTTESGTGVAVPAGMTANLICDGTNIFQDTSILGMPGRLLNIQSITSSGTYTPTDGTNSILVLVVGGGGGGGGGTATSSGYMSGGAGGGAGGAAMSYLTSGFSDSVSVTIGTAGTAGTGGGKVSGAGGTTSFGSLLSATGGGGGNLNSQVESGTLVLQLGGTPGVGSGGNVFNASGGNGGRLILNTAGNSTSGDGGDSYLSGGGHGVAINHVGNAGSLGAGGSGAASGSSPSTGYTAGAGGSGIVIVWEYA